MSGLQLRPGARVYNGTGAALLLDKQIGKGGEGSVWSIHGDPSIVAKFYHNGIPPAQARKLEAMCRLRSDGLLRVAAWPTAVLGANPGQVEGLLMRRITGYQEAHLLYSPKSRRTAFPEAQFPFIIHTATNIARAFAAVHDAGQVIGDVNHANLLVSDNGTVALIDCDSFEITDQGTVFPCLVGVPTYTPPELQGRSFQGIRRTQQHDAFGLAVLVFHMLFLGRHPFAGIYRNGTTDITVERAIKEHRFAYLPDRNTTEMEQPPSAPRLLEFSPAVSQLFIRAFTSTGTTSTRASAHEWIGVLDSLAKNIKQCPVNNSHHFLNHLASCPWCRIEGTIGIPMFGIRLGISRDVHFDITSIWGRIEAVGESSDPASIPLSRDFHDKCEVDPKIGPIVKDRRRKRLMSSAVITVFVLIVAFSNLPFIISITVLLCGLSGMVALWSSGGMNANAFKAIYENCLTNYKTVCQDWNKVKDAPPAFFETRKRLNAAKLEFSDLPVVRARKMAELNATRRQKQLQYFLERHRIDDASLPGIGPGRKNLLRAYNIEDAYDVEEQNILNIKGFGPTMRATLLAWRGSVEQGFQFDAGRGIDPQDIRALEQELSQKRANAILALTNGPEQLQRLLVSRQLERSAILLKLQELSRQLAQAEVNMNALRGF